MDKEFNNNGYDYVDLGLPSGTLWTTMNVGASKPSDYGLYFQWGDTKGYTKDQVGIEDGQKKFALDWSDYKFGASPNFTKYNAYGATLELEDDAANANMGGDWHIPSPTQISELLSNTTSTWTTQDGVNGRLFTSKTDGSKSIFFPAAGFAWDGSVLYSGGYGIVWSSMLGTDGANYGQDLYFGSDDADLGNGNRYGGFSVRGVIDKNNDEPNDKKSNMNEILNLVEILKDAPKGTKLWSPICGDCELVAVDENLTYPIKCKPLDCDGDWIFRGDGHFSLSEGAECLLFPSKENKDWSTFKVPKKHKHFEIFQKVLRVTGINPNHKIWIADFYSHYDEATGKHYLTSDFIRGDDEIMPYEGNEDKVGKEAK